MLNLEGFISSDRMFAPPHPLAENLMRHLPDVQVASSEEVREIQLRDRIPGLVKRLIPLNPLTAWEYWWCVPGRILLPEDMELLNSDRNRVEEILSQLVWLLGGHCFSDRTPMDGDSSPLDDWQQVLAFVQATGVKPDLLDIDFFPTAIEPRPLFPSCNMSDEIREDNENWENCVAIEPGHWHIEFFQLEPIEGGFAIVQPKQLCSCQIWTGKPFIKNVKTGETITRYDLWVSCPHDLISPLGYHY